MSLSLSSFSAVGFCGARSLLPPLSSSLASAAAAAGLPVLATCASGPSRLALAAAGSAGVCFPVQFPGRAGFASRAQAFIRSLASHPRPLLVSFPSRPCPPACHPSRSWCSCGSGTWSETALAVGLSVPVVLFLPPGVHPPGWGAFSFVSSGLFAGGWVLFPPRQPSLF